MIKTLRMTLELLTPHERRQLWGLLALVIVMALLEMAGVASVTPFLAVLANPELVETQPILNGVYQWLGFETVGKFLFFLGFMAFITLVCAAVVRMYGHYTLMRFAQLRRHSISARLLEGYLGRPYEFFLGRHSGALSKSILSEVDQAVITVMQPAMMMLGQGVTLIAIATLLILVDPLMALGAGCVLGLSYLVVYGRVKGILAQSGERRASANAARFEAASEALGGIKDIKLLGRERAYLDRFSVSSEALAREIAKAGALSDVPRYAIEAVSFGGILLISLLLLMRNGGTTGGSLDGVLPLLGLFAFAGYRMMPAIQAIYRGITQINFGAPAVKSLHADLMANREEALPLLEMAADPMGLKDAMVLQDVSYRYPGEAEAGIQGVSFDLPALSTLGVVGGTGAGKTTLIDVILGLLVPQSGEILVDGKALGAETLPSWRAGIGYVPQEIFLLDASIEANIAMGLSEDQRDPEKIRAAARLAQIDSFVESLPDGYETKVGERGVRLSGGQRQRIGIARALYHNPDIIIFDEATSALDNATEAEVMAAIDSLAGQKTVILIAHRLTTVERCDRILVLEKGTVAGLGTYDELASSNVAFQRIARAATAA